MYRIIAHRYPNNEIRVTYSALPHPKPFSCSDPLEDSETGLSAPIDSAINDDYSLASDFTRNSPNESDPAYLSLVSNSKSSRYSVGYGLLPDKPTRFGLNAKRSIIRAGGALDHVSKPEDCLFLTGTLPGSTADAFMQIAAYSAYLVNGLKAWISNYIPNKYDFYVWEYQKRGALHLHYCIHAPCPIARKFILENFRDWWIKTLHTIGNKSNCDLFKKNSEYSHRSDESKVRAVAEVCRKSPARYLAKYLSKSIHPKRGNARFFSPSRWWGSSRPLKKLLESLTDVTEVIVGNYHSVVSRLEDVYNACYSSESVTYGFEHKYGIGKTIVCYPKSPSENKSLWISLNSLSTTFQTSLKSKSGQALHTLEVSRIRLVQWLQNQSNKYQREYQGLHVSLIMFLNLTRLITLSRSSECLKSLMEFSCQLWNIKSLFSSAPYLTFSESRMFDAVDSDIEYAIKVGIQECWE